MHGCPGIYYRESTVWLRILQVNLSQPLITWSWFLARSTRHVGHLTRLFTGAARHSRVKAANVNISLIQSEAR